MRSDELVIHLRGGLVMSSVGLRAADRIDELEAALAAVGSAAAYRITTLEAENAKLRADMHEVMNAVADAARARGEADGKLAASETYGVLEGWMDQCKKAEAKLAKAVEALKFHNAAVELCIGEVTPAMKEAHRHTKRALVELNC